MTKEEFTQAFIDEAYRRANGVERRMEQAAIEMLIEALWELKEKCGVIISE